MAKTIAALILCCLTTQAAWTAPYRIEGDADCYQITAPFQHRTLREAGIDFPNCRIPV